MQSLNVSCRSHGVGAAPRAGDVRKCSRSVARCHASASHVGRRQAITLVASPALLLVASPAEALNFDR